MTSDSAGYLQHGLSTISAYVNAVSDGVLVADGKQRIIFTNQWVHEKTGYTAEELAGASISMLIPGEDLGQYENFRHKYNDEPDIREIGKTTLELIAGWQVFTAESGPIGIEIAKYEKPDLILLDVMMPSMDGPTTLASLRSETGTKDIPVIFLTAKVQPSEIERLSRLGVVGVLAKPFDPMALSNEIESAFRRHRSAAAPLACAVPRQSRQDHRPWNPRTT